METFTHTILDLGLNLHFFKHFYTDHKQFKQLSHMKYSTTNEIIILEVLTTYVSFQLHL